MAHLHTVAALLDELYYMKAVFSLHNLGYFVRVREIKSNGREFGLELTASTEIKLAAPACRTGILGIELSHG